jgi:DNA-binding transcriptional ArsR family regulator
MFENIPIADLAIGRSTVRQRILALLMSESAGRLHLREIQRRAGTSPGTASRELGKLVAAGLIEREAEGVQVYFRASDSPFAAMMRSLLIITPAPPDELPRPKRLPRPRSSAPKAARLADPVADHAAARPDIDAASSIAPGTSERSVQTAPPRVFRPTDPDALRPAWSAVPDLAAAPTGSLRADPVSLQMARRLAESVESLYADSGRLRGVYMYGARAAGSDRADADVETVIVLDRVTHYGAELERTSHLCAALSHELKLIVSRVFVSESDWLQRTDGSLPTLRTGAVEI